MLVYSSIEIFLEFTEPLSPVNTDEVGSRVYWSRFSFERH